MNLLPITLSVSLLLATLGPSAAAGMQELTGREGGMVELKPRAGSGLRELTVKETLKPFTNEKLELRKWPKMPRYKGLIPFIAPNNPLKTWDI